MRGHLQKYHTFLSRLVNSTYWKTNTSLIVIQMSLAGLVGLCQVWALATFLSREELGYWGYCAAIVAIASIFCLPGSSQALAYASAHKLDGALSQTVRLRLKWGVLCSGSLAAMAAIHYINNQFTLAAMLGIAAVFVPIQLATDSADAYLTGRGEFRIAFVRKVCSYATLCIAIIATAALLREVVACTLVNYIGGAIINILFLHMTKPMIRNNFRHDELGKMNLRFGVLSTVSLISTNIERPVLGTLVGFSQLATYQVARTSAFPVSFGRVVEKLLLSRLVARTDRTNVMKDIIAGASLLFVGGWFAYAVLCALAYALISTFLPSYHDALPLMYIMLLQLPFNWAAKPIQSWLYADRRYHRSYWILAYTLPASRLPLLLGGAFLGGTYGAAWGWILSEIAFFLVATYLIAAENKTSAADSNSV